MESKAITKNLYREDEVIAALRYSIAEGDAAQAVFWVQEALESDMDVLVLQTLFMTWLYIVGMSNMPWLGWFLAGIRDSAFTEETMISMTIALATSPKDSSVFSIMASGLDEVPSEPVKFAVLPVPLRNKGLTKEETTFVRAVQQGRFITAWQMAQPLWESGRAATILEAMGSPNFPLETLGPLYSEKFLWPFRALSLLIAHSPGVLHSQIPPVPTVNPMILAEWEARKLLPMRQRRIYPIPVVCLYPYTARGKMSSALSTDSELTHGLEKSMNKSTYWQNHASDYMSKGLARENFYDQHFPNDIPDEWSSADRAKSHGPGVIVGGTSGQELLKRSLQVFFNAPSHYISGGIDVAIAVLTKNNVTEAYFHDYYKNGSTWYMDDMKNALNAMVY
jgi:hypothetical protein